MTRFQKIMAAVYAALWVWIGFALYTLDSEAGKRTGAAAKAQQPQSQKVGR